MHRGGGGGGGAYCQNDVQGLGLREGGEVRGGLICGGGGGGGGVNI